MAVRSCAEGIWVAPLGDGPELAEQLKDLALKASAADKLVGIVVDLSALQRLNAVCLTHLLHVHKAAAAKDASLKLAAPSRHLWPVFRQTGLDKIFDFSPDVSSALAALQLQCGA